MATFTRIDKKLLFYFLLITVFLLGIITFISYRNGEKIIKKQTFSHLRLISICLKGHIRTFIKSQKNIARDFASDHMLIQSLDALNKPGSNDLLIRENVNKHLVFDKMNLYSPRILSISVLDYQGKVAFSTDEQMIGVSLQEAESFTQVKNEGYFGDVYYSDRFYEPVIKVSAPIIDRENNKFCGVVVNTIGGSTLADITRSNWLEEFEDISTSTALGAYYYGAIPTKKVKNINGYDDIRSTEDIYIVNRNKRMITESRFVDNAVLKQVVNTKPVEMALQNGEEMVGIYPNYNGDSIIGASIFIDELGWVILAEKNITETFAPLFRLKAQLITLVIVGLGAIFMVSTIVVAKISTPIKNLLEATKRQSDGDLGFRAKRVSDDELGILTDSFNKMCDDIRGITVSKDYMEKVFSGISESLIIIDSHFIIKRVNPATLNILNYSEPELMNWPVSKIFGKDAKFLDYIGLNDLVKHEQVLRDQNGVYIAKTGQSVPVSISASVIRDCKHKAHPEDCINYRKNVGCVWCKAINIIIVARDMRIINTLIQKEKERVFELTTIQEISRRLGYTLNYDDLFRIILNPLHTAINFDIAGSVLCNDPDDLIYIRRTCLVKSDFMDWYKGNLLKTFVKLSGNKHQNCRKEYIDITSEKIDVVDDDTTDSAYGKIKSYFNVPLIVRGKIVGIINISSFKENAFEANHIRMLYTIANQVTISIQHLIALIEHEKGKLTSILRDMIDGVIMVDNKGIIEMVNPAGEKLLKYLTVSRQGDLLAHLGDYYLKDPMIAILNNEKKYISQELSYSYEFEQITFSMVMSPIRGEINNLGVVIVLRDITKEHNLQQQLLHAEKLSTIGEMVSGIAHEINNPLAGVMGLSQLLQIQPNLPDAVRKNVDKIFTYTDRAKRIIQNLLTFARAHKPEKIQVNINQLIEQTLEMHEYNMKTNDIAVEKDFGIGIPDIVVDMYQLQQVIFNIINNAYQALLEYDRTRIFTVKTEMNNDALLITFHNTGLGISNEVIKKMFNPFFTTKEVGKGTGMGLSISYGIIKEHGGDIFATSKNGEGVTFLVKLPLMPEGGDLDNAETSEENEELASVQKMVILVVDDEITVADSIASLLETDNHECYVTTNVDDAIKKLAENKYDLVISDVKMPGLDGKEFYAYLQLNRPELTSRFIIVTGDVVNPDTKEFVESNHIHCITKPFTFDELKRVVSETVSNNA